MNGASWLVLGKIHAEAEQEITSRHGRSTLKEGGDLVRHLSGTAGSSRAHGNANSG
jgi:hypothetical protein